MRSVNIKFEFTQTLFFSSLCILRDVFQYTLKEWETNIFTSSSKCTISLLLYWCIGNMNRIFFLSFWCFSLSTVGTYFPICANHLFTFAAWLLKRSLAVRTKNKIRFYRWLTPWTCYVWDYIRSFFRVFPCWNIWFILFIRIGIDIRAY